MTNQPGLSEAEFEVLKILWDLGPATVRAVNEEFARRGRIRAYTTISTLLMRLATKGCVTSDSSTMPHVYQPIVTRAELVSRRLDAAADELCDGDAVPLVLALVQKHRFKPADLERFQDLLDEARQAEAAAQAGADIKPEPGVEG